MHYFVVIQQMTLALKSQSQNVHTQQPMCVRHTALSESTATIRLKPNNWDISNNWILARTGCKGQTLKALEGICFKIALLKCPYQKFQATFSAEMKRHWRHVPVKYEARLQLQEQLGSHGILPSMKSWLRLPAAAAECKGTHVPHFWCTQKKPRRPELVQNPPWQHLSRLQVLLLWTVKTLNNQKLEHWTKFIRVPFAGLACPGGAEGGMQ